MSKYTKIPHSFKEGQILQNDNGYDYLVVDAGEQDPVLFSRVKDGELVIGIFPRMYIHAEKDFPVIV